MNKKYIYKCHIICGCFYLLWHDSFKCTSKEFEFSFRLMRIINKLSTPTNKVENDHKEKCFNNRGRWKPR